MRNHRNNGTGKLRLQSSVEPLKVTVPSSNRSLFSRHEIRCELIPSTFVFDLRGRDCDLNLYHVVVDTWLLLLLLLLYCTWYLLFESALQTMWEMELKWNSTSTWYWYLVPVQFSWYVRACTVPVLLYTYRYSKYCTVHSM